MGKPEKTRVLILEPSEHWRQHLKLLIGESSSLICVKVAAGLDAASATGLKGKINLIVAGFGESDCPRSVVAEIRQLCPSVPIVTLGSVENPQLLVSLLVSGADAVVSKNESSLRVLEAIETVRRGGVYLSVVLAKLLVEALRSGHREPQHLDGLSSRELEVLRCLATGLTDCQIAVRLGIAPRTVSTHLHHIYGKLGVQSRSAAVAKYFGQHVPPARDERSSGTARNALPRGRSAALTAVVGP